MAKNTKQKFKTIRVDEAILQDLQSRYKKAVLNKVELANELDLAVSSINNFMAKGFGIPSYKRIGSRVVFPIANVAEYLSRSEWVA